MDFVLDCSVTLSWFLEDEATPSTDRIQDSLAKDSEAYVPALWSFEIGNAFWVSERRKRIQKETIRLFLEHLNKLPIHVEPSLTFPLVSQLIELARNHKLSVYDAAYLELAIRKKIPLATLDSELIQAAKKMNVSILK